MNTIAIVGAGPLLGLAIARKFGRHGFNVALISRRGEALKGYVQQLEAEKIKAAAFPADVTDPGAVAAAFSAVRDRFGEVDVLEFSPTDWGKGKDKLTTAVATTEDSALADFKLLVQGAVSSARAVVPGMQQRKQGALFFTTGYSAIKPLAFITSLGIANSGLRNYAYCLAEELGPQGIYVGTVSINAMIAEGTDGDPNRIAELYWDMYEKRDRIESVFGPTHH